MIILKEIFLCLKCGIVEIHKIISRKFKRVFKEFGEWLFSTDDLYGDLYD